MKHLLHIIVGTSIFLSGLSSAFGFTLLKRGKSQSANRWPYSFGDRYIYDNGGSNWNYDSLQQHRKDRFHRSHRHYKHRHLRFQSVRKRPSSEKLDRLVKNFTRNSSRHNEPFHLKRRFHYDHIDR